MCFSKYKNREISEKHFIKILVHTDTKFIIWLTLSVLQTKKDTCANSVDPDEPSHQDLHCLPFCFVFIYLF